MEKNKKTLGTHIKEWLTPSLVLGAIVMGAYYGGEFKAISKTVQFVSPAQKEKTRQHIDSDYNEVRNYQLMEQVTEMKVDLDTAYAFVNAIFKEDRAAKRVDSINSYNAIKSRAKRDSLREIDASEIQDIKKDVSRMENAVQLILLNQQKILDTIN